MRIMPSYVCLLLLAICCWQCMASKDKGKDKDKDKDKDKKPVPIYSSGSKEASAGSKEASSGSGEGSSGSKEGSSGSKEASSGSGEGSSGSGEDSSSEEQALSCKDNKKNKGETDIDCGGDKCPKCADTKICKTDRDCISDFCKNKKCATQSITATTKTTEKITTMQIITGTVQLRTTTTTPESTTTTPEATTTTPEATTTTPEATTTTPEATTTTPEATTMTPEANTTAPETTTTSPTCDAECNNGGTCIDNNVCACTSDFSGPTCDVQSVGLCLDAETFSTEPILLITFGNGSSQYSTATPADFHFSTTYQQGVQPVTKDGMFSFINSVHNDFSNAWHTNATDHSEGNGGYMYLVNADFKPGQFYNGRVDNLCVGLRYEFSVYLANLCKPAGKINPNVLFEVRSVDGNTLLAQLNSGDVLEHDKLTWEKYGFSFIAPESSVNLLMISNTAGGGGNDLVIDDIALRVCASRGTGFCPSN